MTVRLATIADEEALYWQVLNDLNSDNNLGFSPSAKKVYDHIHACCTGKGGIAGVIDGPGGYLIGSIGIESIQPWHSQDWFLIQVWQFVLPEYRKGTHHAEDLFAFAEAHRRYMSSELGYDIVLETTVMSHKRLEAKSRLWRRRGGKQIGAMFWSGGEVV